MRRNTKFAIIGTITDIFAEFYVYCVAYIYAVYVSCMSNQDLQFTLSFSFK